MDAHNLYYPVQAFMKAANAAVKPSTDFEDVMAAMGARGIGLRRSFYPGLKITHARNIIHDLVVRATLPRDKVVVLQYPMQYHIAQTFRAAKRRGNKIVIVVHDINRLRGADTYNFDEVLAGADVIIAHTPAMKEWLQQHFPGPEVVVLGVFDYMQPDVPVAEAPAAGYSIVFAGNLRKSTFLGGLDFGGDIRLVLYGVGCPDELAAKPFVEYKGSCMPEEIPARIAPNSFGLVWDGSSVATCDGAFGRYLQYNAPYKLSSYIAAGLPVIVWNRMGIREFVESNGIGIAVGSLDEVPGILSRLSADEYSRMRDNVRKLQARVSEGYHARRALEEALSLL